VKTLGKHNR